MKKLRCFIVVILTFHFSLQAQFVGPHFLSVEKGKADSLKDMKTRGIDLSNGITDHWFIPFRQKGDMIKVYSGEYDRSLKNAFNELQVSAFSFGLDTSQTNSVFVEVASFIPNVSIGRFCLGVQVTRAELQDSINRNYYQTLAMNKLMNGGGNFALTFSRPLIYVGNSSGSLFFVLGAALTAYTDASFMNSEKYNPGLGGQLGTDFDFRFSAPWGSKTRQVGNIFRVGVKGRGLFNMFNVKFSKRNQIDEELSTSLFGQIGAYIGLLMFNFDVLYNGSTAHVFDMDNFQFRFSVTPVKF